MHHKARKAGIPTQIVPKAKLNRITNGALHQGAVAVCSKISFTPLEVMLQGIARNNEAVRIKKPRLLVLDGLEDPRNYGAVIRSAVAAGVKGIIVTSRRMAPLGSVAVKASAGTASRIPIARTEKLPRTLYQLKERGYYVAGTQLRGGTSVWSTDWNRPIALVLGGEKKGLRTSVAEECDFMVSIPMPGDVESLNVSVAAGILLFAAARTNTE